MSDRETQSTDVLPKLPSLHFADVLVRVESGPEAGQELRLGPGTTRVGTAASCRLRLTDATVSRMHCELRVESGGVTLADCGSTNGTFVNGLEIVEVKLGGSARVDLGKTRLA